MTKHTSKRWKVVRRFDIYEDRQDGGGGGTYIGTTRGNGPLPDGIEKVDETNAILMAAAPELFECTRMLAMVAAEGKFESDKEMVELLVMAKNAIAKATGKE